MPNPDPNRATRFRPGRSGNPGGKPKGPERVTILRAAPKIRSLEEVRADPRGWRGRMVDLLRSVAEDPEQPIELRLSCANSLLRFEGAAADDTQTRPNYREMFDRLTNREKRVWLHLIARAGGEQPEHANEEMAALADWLAEPDDWLSSARAARVSAEPDAPPASAATAPSPTPAAKPRKRAAKPAEAPAAAERCRPTHRAPWCRPQSPRRARGRRSAATSRHMARAAQSVAARCSNAKPLGRENAVQPLRAVRAEGRHTSG